jgi:3' terminal RNA ribose 2'-O-methyltransferase Hen1
MAFERLAAANVVDGEVLTAEPEESEDKPDKKLNLNTRRLGSVVAALKTYGVKRVIDIGCGEGNLLNLLVKERQFTNIAGVDVSHIALERASEKLKLERAGDSIRERIQLFQGSLTYKDSRFSGYDAACVVEVIEHLDVPRLAAFERVLFEFAKPPVVVLTTPNKEYNTNYDFLYEDDLRHGDHRFEWSRAEFRYWANQTAEKFGYIVQFSEIGDADETHGAPTQMGVFTICG